jgi:hypothetical protein
MVDFIGSFQKGLDAAQKAEKNKQEIYSVLRVLNEQLMQVSDGKLEISIYTKSLPLLGLLSVVANEHKGAYSYLAAINPLAEKRDHVELAKWKLDSNGYPLLITTSDYDIYCEDKEAVEKALQDLISNPVVGEKLYSVMKQKPKSADQIR